MTARAMVLVAVVLQVALTPALSAQDAAGFAGEWIATKDTKGITSVKIVEAPSGRTVHAETVRLGNRALYRPRAAAEGVWSGGGLRNMA